MTEKITIEQFQLIKSQLLQLENECETYMEIHKNDETYDEEAIVQNFLEKYYSIQTDLLNHDLSDIPFEAWKSFVIYSDENHAADFSKTRANIDFSIVTYLGNGNFRGCNVRNLDKIQCRLNPNEFDELTIQMNPSLFLSDSFSGEFKDKYYSSSLTIADLATLSPEQLAEIKQKNYKEHLHYEGYYHWALNILGIDKAVQLYNNSQQEYEAIQHIIAMYHPLDSTFIEHLRNTDVTQIKKNFFTFAREQIVNSKNSLRPEDFPKLFVEENHDIFLIDVDVPAELKQRYLTRTLRIKDLVDYPEAFKNIFIDNFMNYTITIPSIIKNNYGMGKFQELVQAHPDVFIHLEQSVAFDKFKRYFKEGGNLESDFVHAVKEYFLYSEMPEQFKIDDNGQTIYNVPEWLSSMNFHFVERLNNITELLEYTNSTVILDESQRKVIDTLNIDNIRRFEQDTGFFSYKSDDRFAGIDMLMALRSYFRANSPESLIRYGINFKNGNLSYDEFLNEFVKCLEHMKSTSIFIEYPNYDFIQGEFRNKHPEIFIDQDAPEELKKAFYANSITPEILCKNREFIKYLIDKNLSNTIKIKINVPGYIDEHGNMVSPSPTRFIDEYVSRYGNEKLLKLIAKYGIAMNDITLNNFNSEIENEQALEQSIRNIVYNKIIKGYIDYSYLSTVPEMVSDYPELFLSEDAPEELKQYFYNYDNKSPMTFEILQKHKEWLPYLKDKSISMSLIRNSELREKMAQYFELFGEEKAIQLGINRAQTVTEMMKTNQLELMKSWYDKTGGKFIPDFVVMQNFTLEEADKFLESGAIWSSLMKNDSYAKTPESREAMLKLAYSFGAFDQDQRGINKVKELLMGLPKKFNYINGSHIVNYIDKYIDSYAKRALFFNNSADSQTSSMTQEQKEEAYNKMIEYIKNSDEDYYCVFDNNTLINLLESLKKENVDIDFSKPIFSQIYKQNEDQTYSLAINTQSCPNSVKIIRGILLKIDGLPIITPDRAHKLFGGFELKYDPDFREFLLKNIDTLLENPEYIRFVSNIQRQFSEIKRHNSNRTLTWDLAISYVQANKYTSVNIGNERVAEISAIAGYSEFDFEILQQIYNYGKQRTFSSIPRIESSSGKYTYEILRLDDPLALAIGTLTNCCQELGNCAEACMAHSMVDKNGRVFVVKDQEGNIVAQSWVWRNKDVLCFDNIEIPVKAFSRLDGGSYSSAQTKIFTDEIYEVYKQAAHDLIEVDEKVYRELLEEGKITQEQYDGLRLGKITVGLGYNDIAESIKQNATADSGTISRPLPFESPVKLFRGLYTNDSYTQYILEERNDRTEYDGDTIPVHMDSYIEYDDLNFTKNNLFALGKLEYATKEGPGRIDVNDICYDEPGKLVTTIARNYRLNPETTRIIMSPNFAIIYDTTGDKLKIGDLLFNTKVDNGEQQIDIENEVIMQMRLALEQISIGKAIDVSSLDGNQQDIYTKIVSLTDEIDVGRGVGHARK